MMNFCVFVLSLSQLPRVRRNSDNYIDEEETFYSLYIYSTAPTVRVELLSACREIPGRGSANIMHDVHAHIEMSRTWELEGASRSYSGSSSTTKETNKSKSNCGSSSS